MNAIRLHIDKTSVVCVPPDPFCQEMPGFAQSEGSDWPNGTYFSDPGLLEAILYS